MNQKFIIFAPFLKNFTPLNGTTIRIAGYTKGFTQAKIDFLFFSSVKPNYITNNQHITCKINKRWTKLLIIHNILYAKILFRPFSYLLRFFLNKMLKFKNILKIINNRLIITHQEYSIALYLYLVFKKEFIYDIHGILEIQKEYRVNLNYWRKFWFDMYILHEKIVLKEAPFLNVVSNQMRSYVENSFLPKGKILIAPDGIPETLYTYNNIKPNILLKKNYDIKNNQKIILFAGSFKKIGGVSELVKVYIKCKEINSQSVLLLIGSGQEESYINELINESEIKNKIFKINQLPHLQLIGYMKMVDVIVCPDINGNKYNEITPHIKLYDAIASGCMVIATDFQVNKEIFDEDCFNITYFSFSKGKSLAKALLNSFAKEKKNQQNKILSDLTYLSRTKVYLERYFK